MLANLADGTGLEFARRAVATIRQAVGPVTLVADPAVLKGRRFGNIVAIASRHEHDFEGLARRVASGFPPAVMSEDARTTAWLRGAEPFADSDATGSPSPDASMFLR